MKKVFFLFVSVLILGLVFAGCGNIAKITAPGTVEEGIIPLTKETAVDPYTTPLYADQDIEVGKVLVWDDGEELCVRYELNETALLEGWLIYETHWAVATSKDSIPQNKKKIPQPGKFPYGDDQMTGVDEYQECISFEDLDVECEDNLVIAAHAVVEKWVEGELIDKETAWGDGTRFVKKGDWAMYFDYTVTCEDEEPELYTVIFNSKGGTAVSSITGIAYNATVTLPAAPTKALNTFAGWFSDDGIFTNSFTASTPVTASITVYAKWTADTYTVTFNSNGGSAVSPVTGIAYNATVTLPTAPTKALNTFAGWFSDDGTFLVPFTAATPVITDVTVYAKWTADTYTVTFNKNGGDADADPTTISGIAYNGNVGTLPAAPTKALNTFNGWNTAADGLGAAFDATTPVIADITVYAKWTADTYTVTFNKNGGDADADPTTISGIAYNGNVGTLPAAPTKALNTFVSWNTAADGLGAAFDATTPVIANITVYAQWTAETYTVTFDSNGGSAVDAVTGIAYNATVTLPTAPTKALNTFAGWFSDDGTFLVPFTAATPVITDVTVYAKWTAETYTVTFDSNGGSAVSPITGIAYNATVITLPADQTLAGNTFAGWFTDDGTFTNPFTAATPVTASITVYAQWTAETYTVTFDSNGGSAVDPVTGIAYNATVITLPADPTLAGNTFVGWFSDDTTFTNPFTAETLVTASITVYAKWTATYIVTFSVYVEETFRSPAVGSISATDDSSPIDSGASVEAGSVVVFTAVSSAEYQVKDWYLNNVAVDSTIATYTIGDLQAAVDVQVEFELIPVTTQYTLTVNIVGNGSVEVDDDLYTVPVTVDEGTVLGLEAIADSGWQFDGWTGDLVGSNATESITMNGNKAVTATFSELTYTSESCFIPIFNSSTGTIIDNFYGPEYDYGTCGTEVVIPPTIVGVDVLHIGSYAFYDLPLTSVIIPYGVTSIGDNAFYQNNLNSVTIPNSVTSIGFSAFNHNQLTSVDIPDYLTTIAENAFVNNLLASVDIPYGVTSIGIWAFGHNNLTSVTIPNSVTNIGTSAFSDNLLASVIIGSGVTTINAWAFYGNTITSITIGANVNINDAGYQNTMGMNEGFKSVYDNGGKLAGTYTCTGDYTWVMELP
jgi:uncharacterized repeat protein (TIGR02543 family)